MILAKRYGQRVSKYSMSETQLVILSFTFNGLRNLFSLLYLQNVPPALVMLCYALFLYISGYKIYQYLERATHLFKSIKLTVPRYIQNVEWILGDRKRLLFFLHLSSLNTYVACFTPFIFSSETQQLYLIMIHMIYGALSTGYPLSYCCYVTYRYLLIWEKNMLDMRSHVFKTTPKAADAIILNLTHLKKSLFILSIATTYFATMNLSIGIFLPLISKDVITSYIILVTMDFFLPICLFFAAMPTAIKVFADWNRSQWNDIIEDIQVNMAKSIGTYVNPEDLEVDGVKPFDLQPVRTQSDVMAMDR